MNFFKVPVGGNKLRPVLYGLRRDPDIIIKHDLHDHISSSICSQDFMDFSNSSTSCSLQPPASCFSESAAGFLSSVLCPLSSACRGVARRAKTGLLSSVICCLPSVFCFKSPIESLVTKPILVPAVRALPGDSIAGHAPYVFSHAFLADIETASTAPAEAKFLAAAMALKAFLSVASAPVSRGWCRFFHGCCFTTLLI